MNLHTLTWRSFAAGEAHPIDGSALRPDTLGPIDAAAIAKTQIRIGRETVNLGDVCTIDTQSSAPSSNAPILVLRNAPLMQRVGANMASGTLTIEGDAGDRLGASMRGGIIRVLGRAGHDVGGTDDTSDRGMTGGTIVIHRDAGDSVGHRMRRGLIAVQGRAGKSPGYRAFAGTVVVARGALDHPGIEMRRGTILALDRAAAPAKSPLPANFVPDGVFAVEAMTVLRLLFRRLQELGVNFGDAGAMHRKYLLASGDRFELGKGELWLNHG